MGLSNGLHSVTVYANDTCGNMGASETVAFTVSEPFPVAAVAVVSGALIAMIAGAEIVLYHKRSRRSQKFS
jgi:roadblock/LC7 domain-containing protein